MKSFFGKLWSHWKVLTHYTGDFQARVLLTVFYFTLALPFGLIGRFIIDPLRIRQGKTDSHWIKREAANDSLKTARNQF